jgi:hypothetical protein
MNVVSKDLLKKQEFLKTKAKAQSEEYQHLYNTHKLEKETNKVKKKDEEDEKEAKKKEITFNFDNWKKKYVYPYLKGVSESIQCEDETGRVKEY